MMAKMNVSSRESSHGDGIDPAGLRRPEERGRCLCILSGCAILLGFLLGCSKDQPGRSNPLDAGGSSSGGSYGQAGSSGPGGTSSASLGGASGGKGGSSELGGTSSNPPGGASGGKGGTGSGGTNPQGGTSAVGGAVGGKSSGGDAASTFDAGTPDTSGSTDASVAIGNPHRMILCDEGNKRLVLLDLDKTTAGWQKTFSVASLRDIQLIGNNLLGVSTAEGYMELDLATGETKKTVKGFASVESFRRLPNGNTILGMDANGTTLQELDSKDTPVPGHNISFPSLTNFRMFRRTPQGTFLIGAGNKLTEVNWNKETVWEMTFPGTSTLYVYQGLRLPDGTLAVSQGYGATLLLVDPVAKKVLTTIGGANQPEASTIQPYFYAGFQILPNGHFVITNWEGHGTSNGGKGIQLLEYDETGKKVWQWKQDPSLVSSLHHVIVLDGLDTTKLHDDVNGVLAPVTQ